MEIEIIEEKENKIFNRKEIKFYINYEGEPTPKIIDVKNRLVAQLDSQKDLVVVDTIDPYYGEPRALGYAKVYATKEDVDYIETESVLLKNTEPAEEPEEEEEE
ncbi:MAG: 30S ribosomal protein S24e [Methanobrevibacter boviskoreani]|jgi:small subunit ribosomal protein S24e|uniref:30S ribosomal protein S24e n=1 Tax=Methanobrevibacter TaxID=2172 RepID=UPI0003348C6B|nr:MULTISPECIES: 30S ribosomal protein S24e [Methanobrevibacter]AGN16613.1 ribosomal protein S24e Rps24e [Methanobrevibacter sp. AbM4]MCI6774753.1 30S ribosomal protein S24e [Methanobrevibacter boviskoreani]MCI6930568.1 30S ribosomal protein S24e [Methanobrevibacter boviskoreani]MDD6256723.1 30S ribosomal protein S24e [Methanobrevibacter boviskoreani]MDY5614703.1 30S ribosomal protein S24e [Methanobrevibacter boviskoreani]